MPNPNRFANRTVRATFPLPMNCKKSAMELLRREGWLLVFDVEIKLAGGRFTNDLLGAIDIVAYHPARGQRGVQTFTETKLEEHWDKCMGNIRLKNEWMKFGFEFEFIIYPEAKQREEGDEEPQRLLIPLKKFGLKKRDLILPTWMAK